MSMKTGRIAEILAQARANDRATLVDPPRPVTPQSLDDRTLLDWSSGNPGVSSKRKKPTVNTSASKPMSSVHEALKQNFKSSESFDDSAIMQKVKEDRPKKKVSASLDTAGSDFSLFLLDAHDTVDDLKRIIASSALEPKLRSIDNISNLVDRLINQSVKSTSASMALLSSQDEVLDDEHPGECSAFDADLNYIVDCVCQALSVLIGQLIAVIDPSSQATQPSANNDIPSAKISCQKACRYVLRLCMSRIMVLVSTSKGRSVPDKIVSPTTTATTSTLCPDLSYRCFYDSLLVASKSLYGLCTSETVSPDSSNSKKSTATAVHEFDVIQRFSVDCLLDIMSCTWMSLGSIPGVSPRSKMPALAPLDLSILQILLDSSKFAAGIIRSCCVNETNRRPILHMKLVPCLTKGIKVMCQSQSMAGPAAAEAPLESDFGGVLVQITNIIRFLYLNKAGVTQLLEQETTGLICRILKYFKSPPELRFNCARITAKLSLFEAFRNQINSKPVYIECLVGAIHAEGVQCERIMNAGEADASLQSWPHWHTWPLLSRVSFTLGNLTTTNDANRLLIVDKFKCLKPIITLLQVLSGSLSQLFRSQCDEFDDDNEDMDDEMDNAADYDDDEDKEDKLDKEENVNSEDQLEDATVKLIRLLANLSISEVVGRNLVSNLDALEILLDLLSSCTSVASAAAKRVGGSPSLKNKDQHEELLLNVVAACTNITYYACNTYNSICNDDGTVNMLPSKKANYRRKLETIMASLTLQLSHCLFHDNVELVLETSRTLGNLTRCMPVVETLRKTRTYEALVILIGHTDMEVKKAVTGALVNISSSSDSQCKRYLLEAPGVFDELLRALKKASFRHIGLSILICQVYCNLLIFEPQAASEESKTHSLVTPHNMWDWSQLKGVLEELVDCAEDLTHEPAGDTSKQSGNQCEDYGAFTQAGNMVLDMIGGRA